MHWTRFVFPVSVNGNSRLHSAKMEEPRMSKSVNEVDIITFDKPSSFIVITVVFLLIFKIFENGFAKRAKKYKWKIDGSDLTKLPGPEVLPGPTSWDPTGMIGIIFQLLPIEKAFITGLKWSETYGDVVKCVCLNQTWITMNSGPSVQALCKSADLGHVEKSPFIYGLMKPFITNGVLVSTGQTWQHSRKILIKSQSYQSLKAYVPLLNRHCKMFVSSLESLFGDGKPHEINDLINSSFIKIISEMITGFDQDQSDECNQYHHDFQTWKESFVIRIVNPWLLFPPFWKLHPQSRKHDKAVEELIAFARRRIHEHRQRRMKAEMETKVTTSLDNRTEEDRTSTKPGFRSVLDELVDGGVDEKQIIDEINTMLFGGHETGATAIHFFCFCMALNPEIQKECQNEVDSLFEDPENLNVNGLTFHAVSSKLKLAERCILETLRLFPPVFFFVRKLLAPLTIDHNGQSVLLPPGTNVAVSPLALHRKPEYYPEPEKFDPDRFLPEECAKRHPYTFVPFSAGPRNCLGMKFAMIETKTIAAYILRHFSISTNDKMEDVTLLPYITLTPAKDFTFRFEKRSIQNISYT